MFSILIPTFNNLNYLKICIDSLKKNSKFNHQIIVHVNEGNDGTLDYVKKNNFEYTFSEKNIGIKSRLNECHGRKRGVFNRLWYGLNYK